MSTFFMKSLEIKQFRGFEHLCVAHLGRVNLIVGKNNVEKTALLEAIYVDSMKDECVFVRVDSLDRCAIVRWYKDILFVEREEIVKAVQLMVPGVEEIYVMDKSCTDEELVVMCRLADGEILQMSSLGRGVQRVIEMMCALMRAKNGVVLIDEMENGIHYLVLAGLWDVVFKLAEKLNVQVFATTHSWDCIEAFHRATMRNQGENGLLIHLEALMLEGTGSS